MNAGDMQKAWGKSLGAFEIIGAGVDFLTVTTADEAAKRVLLDVFNRGSAAAERLGDRRKKQGFQGFQGWSCGPWFYGRREELWLLRIKGSVAHDYFHDLPWPALHCSRVDTQITIQTAKYHPEIARTAGDVRQQLAKMAKAKLKPAQDLRGFYGDGQTLFIGSRESPRFGRIYDKEKQSGEPAYERAWRFEVEYKKVVAPLVVEWLRQEPDLRVAALESVLGQFDEWALPLPVDMPRTLVAGSIGRRDFDSERSMKWLREQVAPTIERLLGTVDLEAIEEALGLRKPLEEAPPPITAQWMQETGQRPAEPATSPRSALRDGKWW